ncbi:MAG: H-type lectin domain-containing protein [Alphaproteobacteria bacterium]|nr:H-type lectin domain-containing protein [Alphaproteobacteria bacterium]
MSGGSASADGFATEGFVRRLVADLEQRVEARFEALSRRGIVDFGVVDIHGQAFKTWSQFVRFSKPLSRAPRILMTVQGFREGLGAPGQASIFASVVGDVANDGFNMTIVGDPSDVYDVSVLWVAIAQES